MAELEAESAADGLGTAVASLGDASMAAPFTSKLPTPVSLVHIIRQGRCTLVTTHQMFKILAVNCLVLSYQLSVLHLNDVRTGDNQQTFIGMSAAAFFLFLSWAKPVPRLSKERPQTTVFNPALLLSIFSQFLTHLLSLVLVSHMVGFEKIAPASGTQSSSNATSSSSLSLDADAELEASVLGQDILQQKLFGGGTAADDAVGGIAAPSPSPDAAGGGFLGIPPSDFKPNVINTAVFLVTTAAQTCTFLVSYHGPPFMEPLASNVFLLRGSLLVYSACLLGALGVSDDLNETLQLVPMATQGQRLALAGIIVGDLALCWAFELVIRRVYRHSKV